MLILVMFAFVLMLGACGGSETSSSNQNEAVEETEDAAASDEEIQVLEESETLHEKTSATNAKLDSIINNL